VSAPKQIVYIYNGDATSEESETDLQGNLPVPQKDEVVLRGGREWKVVNVVLEQSIGDPKALPVYRSFLSDQL
jgi:hypothetical protein